MRSAKYWNFFSPNVYCFSFSSRRGIKLERQAACKQPSPRVPDILRASLSRCSWGRTVPMGEISRDRAQTKGAEAVGFVS